MLCQNPEPTLREALSDPIIQAVMRADGVDPIRLESELRHIARTIDANRTAEPRRSAN